MERFNIIKTTLVLFCTLFFIEISNYSYLEETTKAVDKFKMGE